MGWRSVKRYDYRSQYVEREWKVEEFVSRRDYLVNRLIRRAGILDNASLLREISYIENRIAKILKVKTWEEAKEILGL